MRAPYDVVWHNAHGAVCSKAVVSIAEARAFARTLSNATSVSIYDGNGARVRIDSPMDDAIPKTTYIDIGKDFATHLGGRLRETSSKSGEEFYEDCLLPAWNKGGLVVVDLDAIEGPSPSFFAEAFGRLHVAFGSAQVAERLRIHASVNAHMRKWIP